MDHDAAHKYIYSLPEVAADLLRLVIPGWVDELDLSTLEDRSSEFLDAAHRKRLADMAWRVPFRGGRLPSGDRPYVLVLVEFQSDVDRRMAKRIREYSEMLLPVCPEATRLLRGASCLGCCRWWFTTAASRGQQLAKRRTWRSCRAP